MDVREPFDETETVPVSTVQRDVQFAACRPLFADIDEHVRELLHQSTLADGLEASLGSDLLAVFLCESELLESVTEPRTELEAAAPRWTVAALCAHQSALGEAERTLLHGGPFDPQAPSELLVSDLELHLQWLDAQAGAEGSAVLADRIEEALTRDDLTPQAQSRLLDESRRLAKHSEVDRSPAPHPDVLQRSVQPGTHSFASFARAVLAQQRCHRQARLRELLPTLQAALPKVARDSVRVAVLDSDAVRGRLLTAHARPLIEAMVLSPILDRGVLQMVRTAERHRALLEDTLKAYVVGYAIAGSWTHEANRSRPDSDVDVLVLINDVDVQRTDRAALQEQLDAIARRLGTQAALECGCASTIVHPTLFLLTDALNSLHQGGAPLWSMLESAWVLADPLNYLRGWQILLRDGRFGVSPVYLDRLRSHARASLANASTGLTAVASDLYNGVVSIAQSLLFLVGEHAVPPACIAERLMLAPIIATAERADELREAARTLERLYEIHRAVKRHPFRIVSAATVNSIMDDAARAFSILDDQCERLIRERRS